MEALASGAGDFGVELCAAHLGGGAIVDVADDDGAGPEGVGEEGAEGVEEVEWVAEHAGDAEEGDADGDDVGLEGEGEHEAEFVMRKDGREGEEDGLVEHGAAPGGADRVDEGADGEEGEDLTADGAVAEDRGAEGSPGVLEEISDQEGDVDGEPHAEVGVDAAGGEDGWEGVEGDDAPVFASLDSAPVEGEEVVQFWFENQEGEDEEVDDGDGPDESRDGEPSEAEFE